MKSVLHLLVINLLMFSLISVGCQQPEEPNKPPEVQITAPRANEEIDHGETIQITADAFDDDGLITEVRFYLNDQGMGSNQSWPYTYKWKTETFPAGIYQIEVVAYDDAGDTDRDTIQVHLKGANSAIETRFGSQQVIATNVDADLTVCAGDLDGDGDPDVISGDREIVWYENQGGGTFGAQHVITTKVVWASVYVCDLDGDGDMDVLSASYEKIAWYENLGSGNFGIQQVLTTQVDHATSIYATDIDGDGPKDVLTASGNDLKISWYKNQGGGVFGSQRVIAKEDYWPESVYACDLDGDGDSDVLSGTSGGADNSLFWYQNQGGGDFGPKQLIGITPGVIRSIYASDLDIDGDPDVISASPYGEFDWYENQGGGNFGPQQLISQSNGRAVYASDLDIDGDPDVISASYRKIEWHENHVGGNSFSQHLITFQVEAPSIYVSDLDGDGYPDVLSASRNKIAWYENMSQ